MTARFAILLAAAVARRAAPAAAAARGSTSDRTCSGPACSRATTSTNGSSDSGGDALAFPQPPNLIEVSGERVRHGGYAAKLTIDAPPGGSRGSAVLARAGDPLPAEAYYSAWYYLPRSISVGMYWVIFKFRQQDQATMDELYDLDLDQPRRPAR